MASRRDVVDGVILVPATSFTTQSTTSPVYNLDQLVFPFPAGQGFETLTGRLARSRHRVRGATNNGAFPGREAVPEPRDGDDHLAGGAFAPEAIVSTTFLDTGTGQNSLQADLALVTAPVDAVPQPIAVTTGRRALAIVNPQTGDVLYSGPVVTADQTVVFEVGQYVAAGLIGMRSIALVGSAVARKLSVVDLTDPPVLHRHDRAVVSAPKSRGHGRDVPRRAWRRRGHCAAARWCTSRA